MYNDTNPIDINSYDNTQKKLNSSDNLESLNFKFIKKFSNQGKQGIAGLISIDNSLVTYKMSQYINHLIMHEALIMKCLTELHSYCPHFCKYFGLKNIKVNGNYRKTDNPFQITCKHPITTDVVLMEYIDGKKLYSLIKNKSISDDLLFSSIKQVLLAISIAQEKKRFTHYDLHSCNILMKECDPNTVFLYILDDENQFCIPTYGMYPVIIDFGFSYANSVRNGPIFSSLAHTDVGFMTNQFDSISDAKLLLVSISEEIKRYRSSAVANKFRNIVRNIFSCLDIDWESGWDNYECPGAADHIIEEIEQISVKSNIFTKYPHYCVDLIQTLIYLPLEKLQKDDLAISYTIMVNEFYKIEREITSSIYHLYIFKKIVDSARGVKSIYFGNQRKKAVSIFKEDVINIMRAIAEFCIPKQVHYERLLCSLFCFANASQRVLYDVIHTKNKETKKFYQDLELTTPVQIFGAIETNIPHAYTFNSATKVIIFDSVKQTKSQIDSLPPELLDILNSAHSLTQGLILNDYLKFENQKK